MMSWKSGTISDFGRVVTGHTPPTAQDEFWGDGYSFVTPTDLDFFNYYVQSTGFQVTEAARQKFGNKFLPPNSVSYTCIGATIGKMCLNRDWVLTNQQLNSIIVSNEHDYHFVYYLLNCMKDEIVGAATGVATPIINKSKFESIKLTYPPLPIQKKIGSLLSAYDDLIEVNLKRIKLLEEMAQITYEEWFVRLHFPNHETTPINPETGLPEGWESRNLGDVATIKWGDTSTTKSKYIENGYTAYSASGPDGFMNYFDYDKAGVVLSAIGAYAGLTWLALGKWSAIKNTMIFWPNDQGLSVYYLYLATRSPDYWNRRGAAQPFIALGDARLQKILVPSTAVVEHFERICAPIFSAIEVLKKTNLRLKEARDLLLPRLMTGLIDVDDYLARNGSAAVAA